jgi:hypothetical protein
VAKVLTIATELKPTLEALIRSCEGKVDLEVTFHPGKWDWGVWLDWQEEKSGDYWDSDLVFVDAYDTLFVGDPVELEALVGRQPLIHSTCKTCWPMPVRKPLYNDVPGPWKYLNSCGPAGTGQAIGRAITFGRQKHPYPHPDLPRDNDQRFWTDTYLHGWGELDWRCEIWQDMYLLEDGELGYKNGRIKNLVHNTWPQFIHASAGTWHFIPEEIRSGY